MGLQAFLVRPDHLEQKRSFPHNFLVETAAEASLLDLDPFGHGAKGAARFVEIPFGDDHADDDMELLGQAGSTFGVGGQSIALFQWAPFSVRRCESIKTAFAVGHHKE